MKPTKGSCLSSLLLCFVLLLSILPAAPSSAQENRSVPENLYGYGTLTDENEKKVYAVMLEGIRKRERTIDIGTYGLSREQFLKIFEILRNDNTDLYYLNIAHISYVFHSNTHKILTFTPRYVEFRFDNKKFEKTANGIVSGVSGSEYEKALALHDYLVKNTVYDRDAENSHNAYGAIVNGRAACEGYAAAYGCLLQRCGICVYTVRGKGKKDTSHTWNLVRLDGKFYHVDVTWDDPIVTDDEAKPVFHAYFALSEKAIKEDHSIETGEITLPESPKSRLHPKLVRLDSLTVPAVAGALKREGKKCVGRIYYTGSAPFGKWWCENYNAVVEHSDMLPAAGTNIRRYSCGHEYYIEYKTENKACAHIAVKVNENPPTCTADGRKSYYKCTVCGRYFEDPECQREIIDLALWKTGAGKLGKKGHKLQNIANITPAYTGDNREIYYKCTVCGRYFEDPGCEREITDLASWKTGAGRHDKIVKPPAEQMTGDVDFSSSITAADARLALRAAVGLEKLMEAQFASADVDFNGKITAADARLILRAAVGLETLAVSQGKREEDGTEHTMNVKVDYSRQDSNNIGKEWVYETEINGRPAADTIQLARGDRLSIHTKITENDAKPDIGEATITHDVTDKELTDGFITLSTKVCVTENRGRNAGKEAHFIVTYTFSAVG